MRIVQLSVLIACVELSTASADSGSESLKSLKGTCNAIAPSRVLGSCAADQMKTICSKAYTPSTPFSPKDLEALPTDCVDSIDHQEDFQKVCTQVCGGHDPLPAPSCDDRLAGATARTL